MESFSLTTCGAELNVAIGLKRLGHNVTYLTKLGNDLFGRRITDVMRSNGISTDEILYSDTHTTGFMFKSKVTAGDPAICYFRRNSAASTLAAEDVERLTGHAPGGVCPFDNPEGCKVYLDRSLQRFSTIFPAAGRP